jgi:Mitochondrial carrier protein
MSSGQRNLLHAAAATAIAEVATLPICTVKTNFQNSHSTNIKQTILSIYNTDGIKGFYRASLPTIGSQVISTSSKFAIYKKLEGLQLPGTNKVINGVASGILSSWMTHPLDCVKVHWQMKASLKEAIRQHGPWVIYRGYTKTVSKVALSSALFFPLYDAFNNRLQDLTPYHTSGAAFLAALTSTLINHPMDYLKTRHIYGQPLYQGWAPKTYYKGVTLNIARVVPHFTIVMTLIDAFGKHRK